MTSWCWNQRSNQSHQIVIHVPWISQSGCWCTHNGWYNRIGLCESWLSKLETISGHSCQSIVINNDGSIGVESQSFHTQKAIIWLHNYIILIWEYTICLDKLLWEPIIQSFEQERTESRSSSTSSTVCHDEAFKRIRSICFSINHINNIVIVFFTLAIT